MYTCTRTYYMCTDMYAPVSCKYIYQFVPCTEYICECTNIYLHRSCVCWSDTKCIQSEFLIPESLGPSPSRTCGHATHAHTHTSVIYINP